MASQPVALDADAAAKAKGMQQITAQWKDAKGNFYFLADKDGDMVAKTAYYLVKVNAQGKIEAELAVNDQLIPNMTGIQEKYSMELLAVQNNTAVLSILTTGNNGVVTVDLDKLTITKEAVCSFIPKTASPESSGSLDVRS